jgi:hypothetical protein
MARDPGSVWAPLPEAGAPDGLAKTQFIVHSTGTMASAAANRNYFLRADVVVESTFIVGLGPHDPTLQVMDSTDRADANGSANGRGISVEVVGDGTAGYTAWQRSELIRLGRWARQAHGIVPRVIPSESAGGFGWHVMFGAPGPWTTQRGKVCPGNARIRELKADIFPAIFGGTAPMEDDMTPEQAQKLNEIHGVLFAGTPATPRNLSVYARLVDVQTALTAALPTLVAGARKGDLDPSAIAAAVVAAIPQNIAQDVIDGLGQRLAANPPA